MKNLILIYSLAMTCLASPSLKIQGSTTISPIVVEASEYFKKQGVKIIIDTQGGSSGGISALGENLVSIAMSSRPLNDSDKKKFPKVVFYETPIGYDGVALVVSKAVHEKGVNQLSKKQIQDIYEKKLTSWKQVGGPDSPIVFYNKEPGRGTWEVFAHYLYGDPKLAPSVTHPEVGGNEEGRTKVAAHQSAMTQLSASWAQGHSEVFALSILSKSQEISPSKENIYNGSYPLKRTLFLYTRGKPTGMEKEFISYVLSPEGQELVKKHGYLSLKELP